jgi:hypothetical protein
MDLAKQQKVCSALQLLGGLAKVKNDNFDVVLFAIYVPGFIDTPTLAACLFNKNIPNQLNVLSLLHFFLPLDHWSLYGTSPGPIASLVAESMMINHTYLQPKASLPVHRIQSFWVIRHILQHTDSDVTC